MTLTSTTIETIKHSLRDYFAKLLGLPPSHISITIHTDNRRMRRLQATDLDVTVTVVLQSEQEEAVVQTVLEQTDASGMLEEQVEEQIGTALGQSVQVGDFSTREVSPLTDDDDDGITAGGVVGIVCAVLLGIGLIAGSARYYYKNKMLPSMKSEEQHASHIELPGTRGAYGGTTGTGGTTGEDDDDEDRIVFAVQDEHDKIDFPADEEVDAAMAPAMQTPAGPSTTAVDVAGEDEDEEQALATADSLAKGGAGQADKVKTEHDSDDGEIVYGE